jgi:nucleotide-binding universal stress UspA family protein
MKDITILLPISADDQNDNLIRSGINLTKSFKGKLALLYIVDIPEYKGYPPGSVAMSRLSNINEQKERLHEHYLSTLDKYKEIITTDIQVEFISEEGTWLTGIMKAVISLDADLLLLQHEHKGLLDKILGETNTEVIRNVEVPVWIIPEDQVIEKPKTVGFLLNHTSGDVEVLKGMMSLCKEFKAILHLLHPTENDYDSRIRKSGFKVLMEEDFPDCEAFHHDFHKDEIVDEISAFISNNKLDILVVKNDDQNFLQRFFSKSSVEKLMDSIEIPIAIY